MAYRNYGLTNGFIVSQTLGEGDFTTIAAASAAAVSGQTIAIADGTYVENFTAKAGVLYTAMSGAQSISNVAINGTVTLTGNGGNYCFSAINFLSPNAGFGVSITATNAFVTFDTCNCNCSAGTFLVSNTASTNFYVKNCSGFASGGNTIMTITSTGQSYIQNSNFFDAGSPGNSTIAAGTLIIENSGSAVSFRSSGSGVLIIQHSTVNTSALNTEALLFNSSDTTLSEVSNSIVSSGTASAISIASGAVRVTSNTITSSNANALTGAGTINFGGNIFTDSVGINVSTINAYPLTERQGGSQATSLTGIVTGNGTSSFTANAVTQHGVLIGGASNAASSLGVAATGTVLAGSTGADPAFTATPTVTSITFGAGTALSAYVENTWTPTLLLGGAAVGMTYITQTGKYCQIGNVVFFSFIINLNLIGSSTGAATITGLPAGAVTTPNFSISTILVTFTAGYTYAGARGSATINLYQYGSAQAEATLTNTNFVNNSQIRGEGFYFTF